MELGTLKPLIPEIMLLIAAAVALLLGLARSDGVRKLAQWVAAAGLLAAFIAAALWGREWLTLPNGSLATASKFVYANYITLLASGIGFLTVLASWNMPATADPAVSDSHYRGEFFSLMLFSLAGVSMVGKVNDLVWLFIVLELVSIPGYVLVATGRNNVIAQEAGVKYFFLGALAAAIFLFGFSYLYGYAGSTRFDVIAQQFHADLTRSGSIPPIAVIGLLLSIVGISYKIAAVPLHFYTPDVYQGAATPVTAYLAFAPKTAGMIGIIIMVSLTGWSFTQAIGDGWVFTSTTARAVEVLLSVLAILTMTIGNVLALLQRNIKRMLAYSSIAHSGYMLVGLVAGPGTGIGGGQADGIQATLFYLGSYAIMNLGAFSVLIYLQGKSEAGEDLDDLAGVAKEHPLAALAMAVCFFSLIGLPPTIGFWAKLKIVSAALSSGHRALAVIVMLNAAVAAAYYLKVVASMYLREAWNPFATRTPVALRLGATVCTLAVVLLGFWPTALLTASREPVSVPAKVSGAEKPAVPVATGERTLSALSAVK